MSIDEKAMRAAYAELRARVTYIETALGIFASEDDLTGPRGDPAVRFELKGWKGENFVQKRYSQCSPDFLEALAKSLTWSVNNPPSDPEKLEKHKKYASGNRKDIALARTWARKLRAEAVAAAELAARQKETERASSLFEEESKPAPALFDEDDERPAAVSHDADGVIDGDLEDASADNEDDLFGELA